MNDALPTATVSGHEKHIPEVILPDPHDRHVVAAGIAAKAEIILTWNLRHFPENELTKFDLRRMTPDEFLCDLSDQSPDLVVGSLANARQNLSKTRASASDFVSILEKPRRHRRNQYCASSGEHQSLQWRHPRWEDMVGGGAFAAGGSLGC